MVEGLKHTRYVYHYTSIDTLFAILERYRRDKKTGELVFRASNIYKLNDPKEMEAGYDIVKAFLREYEKKEIPKEYWLHEIACNRAYEIKCKEDYLVKTKSYIIGTGIVPYTISFSARRDYLPMWSLYGKAGKGVCLKFDAYEMIKNDIKRQIGFVAYNSQAGKLAMKEVIPQMYKWYIDAYKDKLSELSIEKKLRELATICLSASPYIKYKDYKYEKEFRLTHYKDYGLDNINTGFSILDFQQPVNEISSYIEIPISATSLKEIIMGPSMDKDIMEDIIKRVIKTCQLSARVTKSKVPFKI